MKPQSLLLSGLALGVALVAAAPAEAQQTPVQPEVQLTPVAPVAPVALSEAWDPLQSLNRATFSFNAAMTTVIVEPVVDAYRRNVPESVQLGIGNVFTNLREPVTAVSSGLQGDFNNAGISAGRFLINTTAGVGGLFDVATEMGWVSRAEDLGATLCSYGIKDGPYLVLPFLGPSTTREAVGLLSTYLLVGNIVDDPGTTLNYVIADRAVASLSDADFSASLAVDPYLAQRNAYLAFRKQVCEDAIPAADLKASPLGQVKKVDG